MKVGVAVPKKSATQMAHPKVKAKPAKKRTKTKPQVQAIPSRVPIGVIAEWIGTGRAEVLDFAAEAGLPIGNVTDLVKLFRSLFAQRERLKSDAGTSDEGQVCTTYEAAAKALKSRIGIGCAKSVQTWIAQGMPGTPGQGVSRVGRFPIDEMEAWAKANLSLTAKNLDEAAADRRRRKEEAEIRRLEDRIAREARQDAIVDGTLLPRDTYTAFALEIIGTLTQVMLRLPKELLRGGFIASDKKAAYQSDAEKRIRFALSEAQTQLERGPDKNA